MLIISFDAVGDDEFDKLLRFGAFERLARDCRVTRGVKTVFLSNTYPVHTSVATGVTPGVHGLISNTGPRPEDYRIWNTNESIIRVKTLWQAAYEKRIDTAVLFWPVTGYSKTIKYNIPEAIAKPDENQIITNLKAGSTMFQLKMLLRYGKLFKGDFHLNLDSFSTAAMSYILKKYSPRLAFIHLSLYDTLCHRYGKGSAETDKALEALNNNLETLLEAAGDRDVILFTDHSQLNVHTPLTPNDLVKGENGSFIECCGGSAFLHAGGLADHRVAQIKEIIAESAGFRRFLTQDEMNESGHTHAAFGFCAKAGYCYEPAQKRMKATHGYPLDMPGYDVFYMARGRDFDMSGAKGSLLDIAPLAARRLGLIGVGQQLE